MSLLVHAQVLDTVLLREKQILDCGIQEGFFFFFPASLTTEEENVHLRVSSSIMTPSSHCVVIKNERQASDEASL